MKRSVSEHGAESATLILCFVLGPLLFAVACVGTVLLALLIMVSFPVKALAFILDASCAGVAWVVGVCEDAFL